MPKTSPHAATLVTALINSTRRLVADIYAGANLSDSLGALSATIEAVGLSQPHSSKARATVFETVNSGSNPGGAAK